MDFTLSWDLPPGVQVLRVKIRKTIVLCFRHGEEKSSCFEIHPMHPICLNKSMPLRKSMSLQPDHLVFYQRLTDLGEGKFTTLASSSLPVSFKCVCVLCYGGVGEGLISTCEGYIQPRGTCLQNEWDLFIGLSHGFPSFQILPPYQHGSSIKGLQLKGPHISEIMYVSRQTQRDWERQSIGQQRKF